MGPKQWGLSDGSELKYVLCMWEVCLGSILVLQVYPKPWWEGSVYKNKIQPISGIGPSLRRWQAGGWGDSTDWGQKASLGVLILPPHHPASTAPSLVCALFLMQFLSWVNECPHLSMINSSPCLHSGSLFHQLCHILSYARPCWEEARYSSALKVLHLGDRWKLTPKPLWC